MTWYPTLFQRLWRYGYGALGSLYYQGSDGVEVELAIPGDADAVDYHLVVDPGTLVPAWAEDTGSGAGVTDGDKGDITVSGTGATWTVDNDAITDAKLRNSAATSVIGRSANSTGDPADIVAAADDVFLRRRSNVLGFGGLVSGDLPTSGASAGSYGGGTKFLTLTVDAAGRITAISEDSGLVFDPTYKFRGTIVDTDYVDLIVKGFAFTIQAWAIYEATGTASVTVDILKAAWAGTPSFTSMVGGGGNKPTLSTARTNEANVSGWTTTTVDGTSTTQILRAQISGAPTGVSTLTIALKVQRTA